MVQSSKHSLPGILCGSLLAILCLIVTGCNEGGEKSPKPTTSTNHDPSSTSKNPFHKLSFEEALAKAKAEKKIVMVDFYTDWCGWCKELDKNTWKDTRVKDWLNENTVAVKIDADKQPDLRERYQVKGFPTILFINGEGKDVGRIVGYRPPDKFLVEANPLVAK